MAPLTVAKINNSKGQVLWEGTAVLFVAAALISGFFLTCYLLFARSWVLYQGEQALYCIAETNWPAAGGQCRANFSNRVGRFLPWGQLRIFHLSAGRKGSQLKAQWQLQGFSVPIHRRLDLSSLARPGSSRSFSQSSRLPPGPIIF